MAAVVEDDGGWSAVAQAAAAKVRLAPRCSTCNALVAVVIDGSVYYVKAHYANVLAQRPCKGTDVGERCECGLTRIEHASAVLADDHTFTPAGQR